MMRGAAASPGADHERIGKVLAGDPVACWVLALARDLPDAEWDAFILCAEQMGAGVPADLVAVLQPDDGKAAS